MKQYLDIVDPGQLNLLSMAFRKLGITFSKAVAAKLVGGEYRLEKLVSEGKIRMEKPTAKQNGKWFCDGGDVIQNIKLQQPAGAESLRPMRKHIDIAGLQYRKADMRLSSEECGCADNPEWHP